MGFSVQEIPYMLKKKSALHCAGLTHQNKTKNQLLFQILFQQADRKRGSDFQHFQANPPMKRISFLQAY